MIVESTRPDERPDEVPAVAPIRLSLADIRKDMTDIFGDPGPAATPVAPRTRAMPVEGSTIPSAPRARGRRGAGQLLAAATAGLLLGMAAIGGIHLVDSRSHSVPAAAPAIGVAETPFERGAERRDVPRRARVAVVPAATAETAVHPEALRPPSASVKRATGETATPRVAANRPGEATASPGACEGDRLERAWCMRPDILDADRHLRLTYAEAIDQGVERRFLVEHQRRWARLRNLASRDPQGVLEGYRELASDLKRLSIHGRAANRVR
ncbi:MULTISPECIES: hypothetical protein [unclassified Sphingomonas]|uniref:hypothetical protein n=1 Tax=unclassified Sphingomonas TaxID=196159 RepID=UPI0006F1DDB1|nr:MULTISPECIES: hypothetical protein [unclassified Sphingomonas]KQX18094.1 hypothetical protein ASD17_20680 [Sphingomonas sp. Root1294]KQY72649.1 hypothetical protein ASD39_17795 [Sphingomonas sp. Root50]KRB87727.1 hypothetical protein ASE22_23780 [Sphingomonas sp. Root720]